jgi:hypothetical protein
MSKWRAKALEFFPEMRPEIQAADSVGALWVELAAQFPTIYNNDSLVGPKQSEAPALFRAIARYALWCTRSKSQTIAEPAWIEFYEGLPRFALQCKEPVRKKIVEDVIVTIGLAEVEKAAEAIRGYVGSEQTEKFLAKARLCQQVRQRRSRKK